ncbi:MAG: hypothetical protein GAK45_01163 [Pseudomonas citronellolis]|nr:MAG: hypothetical protein GAK45_01163 [Pseudomonas citronellolis]
MDAQDHLDFANLKLAADNLPIAYREFQTALAQSQGNLEQRAEALRGLQTILERGFNPYRRLLKVGYMVLGLSLLMLGCEMLRLLLTVSQDTLPLLFFLTLQHIPDLLLATLACLLAFVSAMRLRQLKQQSIASRLNTISIQLLHS